MTGTALFRFVWLPIALSGTRQPGGEEVQKISTSLGNLTQRESVMTAQIVNLAEYRKAKEAEEVRKVVNDYFATHSQAMAWLLSTAPAR
jgi:hypothetical protein